MSHGHPKNILKSNKKPHGVEFIIHIRRKCIQYSRFFLSFFIVFVLKTVHSTWIGILTFKTTSMLQNTLCDIHTESHTPTHALKKK